MQFALMRFGVLINFDLKNPVATATATVLFSFTIEYFYVYVFVVCI